MADLWSENRMFYLESPGGGTTQAWGCGECGAIVTDQPLHGGFHEGERARVQAVIDDALAKVAREINTARHQAR